VVPGRLDRFWTTGEISPPRDIDPSGPIPMVTRFATVSPLRKLRFEVGGRVPPPGQTANHPVEVGWVIVTFRATATAAIGTASVPRTGSDRSWPLVIGAEERVSSKRYGVIGTNACAALEAIDGPGGVAPAGLAPGAAISEVAIRDDAASVSTDIERNDVPTQPTIRRQIGQHRPSSSGSAVS
jgi:hypothetical protein